MHKYWYLLSLLLLTAYGQLHAEQPIPTEEKASWIVEKQYNLNPQIPHHAIQKGVYYLLVDSQIRVTAFGKRENYRHFAEYIANQNGIEETSQININFDPTYQKLVLHDVLVWRDGKKFNKLSSAKMSLLQREEELENLIYNGEHTLNIILDDIRIGDIIEYSFTKTGSNPVFQNIFGYGRSLQWSVPVDALYVRLLWEKQTPLHHKLFNSHLKLNKKVTPNGNDYWLEQDNVEALQTADDTPSWFDPYGYIQFSELKTWKEVVTWGIPLYEDAIQSGHDIKVIAAEINEQHSDIEKKAAAALQYVQSEVRYLGIELGENSHKPSLSNVTLKRRYGDCKDKTVLLVTLLRELGIKAYPALVNTETTKELIKSLPSITSFDHVIAQAVLNGKSYWLDPTRQYQYGSLNDIYQPDYDYALVVNSESSELISMKSNQAGSLYSVKDSFDLTSENRAEVIYTSQSEYRGLDAERQRDDLASDSLEQTQLSYLDFYKEYYPSINTLEAVIFSDNTQSNTLYASEKYAIPEFWTINDDGSKYDASFYSNAINTYLETPDLISRTQPLSIPHPVNIKQTIKIQFKDDGWDFNNESFIEDNEFFMYASDVKFDTTTKVLALDFTYKTKANYVPVDKFTSYIKALKKSYDNSDYSIYENISQPNTVDDSVNWYLIIISIYLLLFIAVFLLWQHDIQHNSFMGEMLYYPVSTFKLISLCVLTFGIYSIYWFYKNWTYIKSRDHSSIMPAARSIFNPFWYYPLYADLLRDNEARFEKKHLPAKFVAAILAACFLIISFAVNINNFTIFLLLASALLVLPLANYINFINNNSAAYTHNSTWSLRHYLLTLLSIPLLALTFSSEIGLTPNDAAIPGSKILSHHIKFMQRKGIIDSGDDLIYFYSGAFLNIREDGNGFSDRHVFSYWKDDNDEFNYEMAIFDDIKEVKTNWSEDWGEDTMIDIIRDDDSKFILYVSNTDKKDKIFVKKLMSKWEATNTSTPTKNINIE